MQTSAANGPKDYKKKKNGKYQVSECLRPPVVREIVEMIEYDALLPSNMSFSDLRKLYTCVNAIDLINLID